MDLNKMINESLSQIEKDGVVTKIVTAQVESTIKKVVEDALRPYSDFGKNLQKEIESQLCINLKELNIASYNVMIANAVKEKLDEVIHIQGINLIKEHMDKVLMDVKPEYKLSELIKEFMEEVNEDGDYNGKEISFYFDKQYSHATYISFDKDSDSREYGCQYRLGVSPEGKLIKARINDKEFDNKVIMGGLHGFDETIFKIYATGAKIILDKKEVEVEFGYSDEDDY